MAHPSRPLLALALLGLDAARAAAPLVSEEDVALADKLKATEEQACGHPLLHGATWIVENSGLVQDAPEQLFQEAGRKNTLKDQMKDGEFDIGSYVQEVSNRMVFRVPAYLAGFMVATWFMCCCQLKFQCCRCRSHKRISGFRFKLLIWAVLALLCGTVAYFGAYQALHSVFQVEVGLETFLCGAAELISVTYNGHATEPTFPGTVQTLRDLDALSKFLDHGSSFLEGLDEVLDHLTQIYKPAVAARGTLALLDSLHGGLVAPGKCPLCEEMDTLKPAAEDALEDNSGFKLGMLRLAEIEPSEEDKTKIKDGIAAAADPLVSLQAQMSDLGNWLADKIQTMMGTWLQVMVVFLAVVMSISIGGALMLVLCGCTSAFMFTCFETSPPKAQAKEDEAPLVEGDGVDFNPYNPSVHKWASRTWCWGFCYCIVTLCTAAIFSAALVPVTETCLMLADLKQDSSLVDDLEVYVEDKERMKRLVDGCIIHKNGTNGLLMDIVKAGDGAESVSLRKKLADDVNKTVSELFGELLLLSQAEYSSPLQSDGIMNLQEVFKRDKATLTSQLANTDYACDLFEDDDGNECDTKDFHANCLTNSEGTDYEAMKMKPKRKTCTREEFVDYLQEFDRRITVALFKFHEAAGSNKPEIKDKFQDVWDEHIGGTISELSDRTDCRYIGIYYKQLVGGLCYQAVLGFNDMVGASMLSGYSSVALIVAMYILWRLARDNYDHYAEMTPAEQKRAAKEEEALRAEADRSGWVLAYDDRSEVKPPDPSMIPESVRRRQAELERTSSW